MPDETSVVRDETARQVVVLVFGVASVLMYVWVQRWAADPDAARSGRMLAAKRFERGFAKLAGWSWRMAERARLVYDRDRA